MIFKKQKFSLKMLLSFYLIFFELSLALLTKALLKDKKRVAS